MARRVYKRAWRNGRRGGLKIRSPQGVRVRLPLLALIEGVTSGLGRERLAH